MTALGPLDHIARTALPWRVKPDLTECGKPISELGDRVVSREAVATRIKAIGQQRAAFEICMTCASTSDRWTGQARRVDEGISTLAREAAAVEHAYPPSRPRVYPDGTIRESPSDARLWERKQLLIAELRAITALVEAHREEFDGYLAGLGETVSLADRRVANRQRRAR
jgi:NMD protein affecting ribosome stability and mRNA decay